MQIQASGMPLRNQWKNIILNEQLGVCLVVPRIGYALKELKEVGWPKQTLGKGMN